MVILPQTSLIAFLGGNVGVDSKEKQNHEVHSKEEQGSETWADQMDLFKFDLQEAEPLEVGEGMSEDLPKTETVDLTHVKGSVYLAGIKEFRWQITLICLFCMFVCFVCLYVVQSTEFRWPDNIDAPNFHTMGWRRPAGQARHDLIYVFKTILQDTI